MHVTHVIAPGPLGGAETVLLEGTYALHAGGQAVSLVVLDEIRSGTHGKLLARQAEGRGIPTELITVRSRLDPRALYELRGRLKRTHIVHTHGYKALAYSLLARGNDSFVTASHHGETGHSRSVRMYEDLARLLYRRVDRVFSVSEHTTGELLAGGVPRDRIRTVPNLLAMQPTRTPHVESPPGSPLRLLFVGRLSPEKGLDLLLRALFALPSRVRCTLSVAGAGPCEAQWTSLAQDLGLSSRVQFLGVRRDIPELLAQADALALPSYREGLPLAVLEAAGCGVPVIASRVGGIAEVIDDGKTGVLVQAGSCPDWCDGLTRLQALQPQLRANAVRLAESVRDRHAPASWAKHMASHYRELWS